MNDHNKSAPVFQTLLLESLAGHGSGIALMDGEKPVSYGQLDGKSSAIFAELAGQGVTPGRFVGIYTDDRVDFIAAVTGVIKAGGVFVALDPLLPVNRIMTMLRLTGTTVLLSGAARRNDLARQGINIDESMQTVIAIESVTDNPAPPSLPPYPPYGPEDRLYIYFTSGSSGTPKAVVGKNKSLLHFIRWQIETFGIAPGVRVSQLAPPGFDAFLKDVFGPLCAGGTVCIPPGREILTGGDSFKQWLEKSRIDIMQTVPSIFRVLARAQLDPGDLPHLKYILLAGEPVKMHDLKKWYHTFGEGIQLVNLYGTTETTVLKTCYFIRKKDVEKGIIPIGKAIRGSQLVLFDKGMNLCPRGVVGEIYIRTPYRTHGYYNDEALNRRCFIVNPVTRDSSDLLYRTGDLGRELADGNFQCLGRMDRQVKIRGVRVEPGEIEGVIETHPHIETAVVIANQTDDGENSLFAFFTAGEETPEPHLKEYLLDLLPDTMVPSFYLRLQKIPRLANGKTDEGQLRGLVRQERAGARYMPPRTPLEEKLVKLFSDILNIEKIGIEDDFFQSGGRSLDVMKLAAGIKEIFNAEIPVDRLYHCSKPAEIARFISRRQDGELAGKTAGEPYILFNPGAAGRLFLFPPQIGYGAAYKELSTFLSQYRCYCFNFLEGGDPVDRYASLIMDIVAGDPCILCGYSAGGNLAFNTAAAIEKNGGNVAAVIILDSFSRPVKLKLDGPEGMDYFYGIIEKSMDSMGIGFLKEQVLAKTRDYTAFLENLLTRDILRADIHHIISVDRRQREARLKPVETAETTGSPGMVLSTGWETYTSGRCITYRGNGEHGRMLTPGDLENNARLLLEILAKIPPNLS